MASPPMFEEIRAHVADSVGLAPAGVRDDETLLGGLLDSIALLTLAARLESAYGITIDGHEIDPDNFGTLGAISRFVAAKTSRG
ncbi:MAG: acyl carrier protein [Acidobacteria bacterium]|nr:acyl carrier protein [Acidobacteriota bacterium]